MSLRYSLHSALALDGESDTVLCLLEAAADVNERLKIPMSRSWWSVLKMLRMLHPLSPSMLTELAYHQAGATPLIFSILTGKFEIIPILLKAGARMDIPNDRGKTATYFLQKMDVPVALIETSDEDSDETISI